MAEIDKDAVMEIILEREHKALGDILLAAFRRDEGDAEAEHKLRESGEYAAKIANTLRAQSERITELEQGNPTQ